MTKKRNRTIDKIITPVNCKYGAPHGRPCVGSVPNPLVKVLYGKHSKKILPVVKVYDCFIPMRGGYDRGGAYWGLPDNVRVKYTKDLSYIEFYRPGK